MYIGNFTVPGKCDHWTFTASVDNRNNSNNLQPGGNIYVEATINNLDVANASSPQIVQPPFPSVYVYQPQYLPSAVADLDGDSLTFELVDPLSDAGSIFGGCSTVPPAPIGFSSSSFTATQPFSTMPSNPVYLNPNTGLLTFTLQTLGYSGYAIRINKFRRSDGKLLGYITREVQIKGNVGGLPISILDVAVAPQTITGGQVAGTIINTTVGSPLNFCIYASKDPNPYTNISIVDTVIGGLTNANVAYNLANPESLVACYSFLPAIADTGTHYLIFKVQDKILNPDPCEGIAIPILYFHYYVYTVKVSEPLYTRLMTLLSFEVFPNPATDQVQVESGQPVELTLYSLTGQKLKEEQTTSMDVADLPEGVYILKITDPQTRISKTQRLLIQR